MILQLFNGGLTVIYSPALDLSGYGSSEDEAKGSFEIALEEFIKIKLFDWLLSGIS